MLKTSCLAAIIAALLVSCASPQVVTTWRNRDIPTGNIHSVLVAAIVGTNDSLTRHQLENSFVLELKKAGYNAVSSTVAFGANGLANLGQEQTLVKLCNYGFDAVLTVALVDESKVRFNDPPSTSEFIANYYLDRIWNYEKIGAGTANRQLAAPHFWECILYDLYSLRPLSAMQTRLYDIGKEGQFSPGLAEKIIAKMTKQKIIRKRPADNRAAQSVVKR
jgi:hypothetical protein